MRVLLFSPTGCCPLFFSLFGRMTTKVMIKRAALALAKFSSVFGTERLAPMRNAHLMPRLVRCLLARVCLSHFFYGFFRVPLTVKMVQRAALCRTDLLSRLFRMAFPDICNPQLLPSPDADDMAALSIAHPASSFLAAYFSAPADTDFMLMFICEGFALPVVRFALECLTDTLFMLVVLDVADRAFTPVGHVDERARPEIPTPVERDHLPLFGKGCVLVIKLHHYLDIVTATLRNDRFPEPISFKTEGLAVLTPSGKRTLPDVKDLVLVVSDVTIDVKDFWCRIVGSHETRLLKIASGLARAVETFARLCGSNFIIPQGGIERYAF